MTPIAWIRWTIRIASALLGIVVLYLVVTFVQVWSESRDDDARPADVIVVLGAAQYDGQPSPVLGARLDHAYDLYDEGLAGSVIVTGGKLPADRFTEAYSGYEYLRNAGIPDEDLYLEVDGTDTFTELSASALIMADNGWQSALLVSDPYHAKRLRAVAAEVGMADAWVSPADTGSSWGSLARETAAVGLGRIVGYRRMGNLLS